MFIDTEHTDLLTVLDLHILDGCTLSLQNFNGLNNGHALVTEQRGGRKRERERERERERGRGGREGTIEEEQTELGCLRRSPTLPTYPGQTPTGRCPGPSLGSLLGPTSPAIVLPTSLVSGTTRTLAAYMMS